ncbi:MAG: TatD family hydrolase [Methylophilaceae bacterium]|jgi:TatD DNase family protein
MLVDSHCHLNFPELATNIEDIRLAMTENGVGHALCISVTLKDFPQVLALADKYPNFFASVGVHPDYESEPPFSSDTLFDLAQHPKVVAIGETGLDYFRLTGNLDWQRERFRTHIRAAIKAKLPLIIHTRASAEDTLRIMEEENASEVGGVMHCFTETLDVAMRAIEMGFYISFSGIVTFKNASALKEVARHVPLDRILVETDSPYLAPIPFRGKTNQPAYVKHVAEEVARLRNISIDELANTSTLNFFTLFKRATPCN